MSKDDFGSNDDFEPMGNDAVPDDDFGEFSQKSGSSSLSDIWRNSPAAKIGLIAAGLIVVISGIVLFGGDKKNPDSQVATGTDIKDVAGTSEISPAMVDAMENFNKDQYEQAVQTGESAIPVPIEPPKESLPLQVGEAGEEDPLARWKQMQEERLRQQREQEMAAQQQAQQQLVDPKVDQAVQALSGAMAGQMQQIIEARQIKSLQNMQVTDVAAYMQRLQEQIQGIGNAGLAQAQANLTPEQAAALAQQQALNIIIPAGTIEYGQLLNEANSDIPGPIVALLASGPFSGQRVLGTFQRKEEYLVMEFNTLVDQKGYSIPIEAYALDPDTTLSGMATEVDHRYWQRVILPAAAEFVQGMGEAIAERGGTNVTVSGDTVTEEQPPIDTEEQVSKGVEKAAESISDELQDAADDTEILVRVKAGAPLGLLFMTAVTDQDQTQAQFTRGQSPMMTAQQREEQRNAGNGLLPQQMANPQVYLLQNLQQALPNNLQGMTENATGQSGTTRQTGTTTTNSNTPY